MNGENGYSYSYEQKTAKEHKNGSVALLVTLLVIGIIVVGGLLAAVSYIILADKGLIPEIELPKMFTANTASPSSAIATSPDFGVVIGEVPEDEKNVLSTADIAKKVTPSTVGVEMYAADGKTIIGGGSGIILNKEGYVITNAHVVESGRVVKLVTSDGKVHEGETIGADTRTDLAIVRFKNAPELTQPDFADSNNIEIGERVVAIGNPGGLIGTVTQGIISGVGRSLTELRGGATYKDEVRLLQTDAAINPGNSGGPLVNRFGQIIGINSSKIASVEYEGIGFAIPITEALPILENIIAQGKVTGRPVLGISVQSVSLMQGVTGYDGTDGLLIQDINADSDLTNYGIKRGDIILKANDTVLLTTTDLLAEISKKAPGDYIDLEIFKADTGKIVKLSALLIES